MFEEDLQEGEKIEEIVRIKLNNWWDCKLKKNPDKKDIDLIDDTHAIEIKYDRRYETTGNVAFEIYYKDKPSGISTTKATHIAYYLNDKIYVAPTHGLKKWLKENRDRYSIIVGGDNGYSKLALLKKWQFDEIFIRVP